MRKLARALTGITMVVLVFMLVVLVGPHLRVAAPAVSAVPAGEQMELFETITAAVDRGDLGSDQYRVLESRSPDDYQLITYTCALSNAGLLPADWIRLQLSPAQGDIAIFCGDPVDLGAFGRGEATCVLLTRADSDAAREIWAEYYLFGRAQSAVAAKE